MDAMARQASTNYNDYPSFTQKYDNARNSQIGHTNVGGDNSKSGNFADELDKMMLDDYRPDS